MPFKKIRRFFKKTNEAAAGLLNRDAEELHGFEALTAVRALTMEMDDWEAFDTACDAFVRGNSTDFSPVPLSVFTAPDHLPLFRAEIDPDGLTVRSLDEKEDEDESKLLRLRLPDEESGRPGQTKVLEICHPSGFAIFSVTNLSRQKHRFRMYPNGDEEQEPLLRIVKEPTTKLKMAQKLGMTFSGTITHVRDDKQANLGTIHPKIGGASRDKELYSIEFTPICPDYRAKAMILSVAFMFAMRVAVRPLYNVMEEHRKRSGH